jgi:hypothetical protein
VQNLHLTLPYLTQLVIVLILPVCNGTFMCIFVRADQALTSASDRLKQQPDKLSAHATCMFFTCLSTLYPVYVALGFIMLLDSRSP